MTTCPHCGHTPKTALQLANEAIQYAAKEAARPVDAHYVAAMAALRGAPLRRPRWWQ